MRRKSALAVGVLGTAGALALATSAQAQSGVRIGTLSCNVAGGWGFVFGSSKALHCTLTPGWRHRSIMLARSRSSASILAILMAACWSGRCSRQDPMSGRARWPAIMSALPAALQSGSGSAPMYWLAAQIGRFRFSRSALKAIPV
jgi:Protein of unknown function (DUF992)